MRRSTAKCIASKVRACNSARSVMFQACSCESMHAPYTDLASLQTRVPDVQPALIVLSVCTLLVWRACSRHAASTYSCDWSGAPVSTRPRNSPQTWGLTDAAAHASADEQFALQHSTHMLEGLRLVREYIFILCLCMPMHCMLVK